MKAKILVVEDNPMNMRLMEMPAFSYIPIIGITAYAMKGDREKVLESGCDVYLSKPINTCEPPKTIAEMLSKRQK